MEKLSKEDLLVKLESNAGVYADTIPPDEVLAEAGLWNVVALLPNDYDARIRYLGNLLVQLCFNRKSADGKLKVELTALATSLSYLLNSSSFASDEYKDFDRAEIDRKLRRGRE